LHGFFKENSNAAEWREKQPLFLGKILYVKNPKSAGRRGCVRTPCRVERVESLGKSDATTAFNRILTRDISSDLAMDF
jgi:hypothetical protein